MSFTLEDMDEYVPIGWVIMYKNGEKWKQPTNSKGLKVTYMSKDKAKTVAMKRRFVENYIIVPVYAKIPK